MNNKVDRTLLLFDHLSSSRFPHLPFLPLFLPLHYCLLLSQLLPVTALLDEITKPLLVPSQIEVFHFVQLLQDIRLSRCGIASNIRLVQPPHLFEGGKAKAVRIEATTWPSLLCHLFSCGVARYLFVKVGSNA